MSLQRLSVISVPFGLHVQTVHVNYTLTRFFINLVPACDVLETEEVCVYLFQILVDTVWALSYLTDGGNHQIQVKMFQVFSKTCSF